MAERKGPRKFYHISAVARMYDVHPQTLRLYEREGLLKPSRSEGNTRLYSEKDLERLELILNLTRDLGVNLAGVEVILNMRQRMVEIEKEVEFFEGREEEFEERKNALVRISPAKLIRVDVREETSAREAEPRREKAAPGNPEKGARPKRPEDEGGGGEEGHGG